MPDNISGSSRSSSDQGVSYGKFVIFGGTLVFFVFAILLLSGPREGAYPGGRDGRRISDLKQLQNGLELYHASRFASGTYPEFLSELSSSPTLMIARIPQDPQGTSYNYCVSNDKTSYILQTVLEGSDSYQKLSSLAPMPITSTALCAHQVSWGCDKTKSEYCLSL